MDTNEQNHTPGPLTAKWLCEALLVYRDHGGVPTQELVAEIMQRSAAPDLLEALKNVELNLTQTRLASRIGKQTKEKTISFVLGAIERLGKEVSDAIAKAEKK